MQLYNISNWLDH